MRRNLSLAVTAAALVVTAAAVPAQAIQDGEPDDGRHPMVGLMVAQTADGEPLWDCSGTLVSSTVFVTAGHCTSDETLDQDGKPVSVGNVALWFDEGPLTAGDDFLADYAVDTDPGEGVDPSCEDDLTGERYAGYPCTGPFSGAAHTHPEYDPARFFDHDLGVVVLEGDGLALPQYAELPGEGDFDTWRSSTKHTFTSVGYGKQEDYGQGAWWKPQGDVERRVAYPRLVSVNSPSLGVHAMELSNNARTGGTCSGDSGGPNFLDDGFVLAAVTSYGKNFQTCSGPAGVFRLDGADELAWINAFLR